MRSEESHSVIVVSHSLNNSVISTRSGELNIPAAPPRHISSSFQPLKKNIIAENANNIILNVSSFVGMMPVLVKQGAFIYLRYNMLKNIFFKKVQPFFLRIRKPEKTL